MYKKARTRQSGRCENECDVRSAVLRTKRSVDREREIQVGNADYGELIPSACGSFPPVSTPSFQLGHAYTVEIIALGNGTFFSIGCEMPSPLCSAVPVTLQVEN